MIPSHRKRGTVGVLALAAAAVVALLALPGAAAAKDRNRDHIPDRWEKRHHLSLKVNQARRDQDHDQLRNRAEFLAGDNPRRADSDSDGVEDGDERAGTIQSFDPESGRLVIDLFGGDTVAGQVTESTEIACEVSGRASISSDPGDGGDGEEEGTEPGEDNGGQEESGDDNGGSDEAGDDDGAGEQQSGDEDDAGEQQQEDDNGGGEESADNGGGNCSTADLVPGAVVKEAELKLAGGQATFEKVELSGKDA